MARLTDRKAESLIAALTRESGVYAVTSAQPNDPSAWHPAEGVESPPNVAQPLGNDALRVRELTRDAARIEELGRTLTLDLATYLRRPVRCSLGRTVPPIATPWRFASNLDGGTVWIDLDVGLASAFADAMIGGDGNAAIGRGRRVRGLATIAAKRMLDAIASAAGVQLRGPLEAVMSGEDRGQPAAGGLCAVAVDEFPWALGVFAQTPAVAQSPVPPVAMPTSTPANPATISAQARRAIPSATPVPRAMEPDQTLRTAIDALDARLAELTHNRVLARAVRIEHIDGAEVAGPPTAALGLALIAGGNGAVVAFADAVAVSGIAGAAVGPTAHLEGPVGEVALAAAEAVVRDALERAALRLPALGDEGHRVVRLSDDPLTARTPHHAADIEVSSEGTSGTLRVLVPSWMLEHRERKTR